MNGRASGGIKHLRGGKNSEGALAIQSHAGCRNTGTYAVHSFSPLDWTGLNFRGCESLWKGNSKKHQVEVQLVHRKGTKGKKPWLLEI